MTPLETPRSPASTSIARFSLAMLASFAIAGGERAQALDHSKWRQDYAQLKAELAQAYANLDTLVAHRKLDLVALDQRTLAELDRAESDADAVRAFNRLLSEFADGHLRLLPPAVGSTAPASAAVTASPDTPTGSAHIAAAADRCARLGYKLPRSRGLSWDGLAEFTPVGSSDDQYFPSGVLRFESGRRVGLVRIGLFGEDGYPAACVAHIPNAAACDRDCQRDLRVAVAREMTQALARQIRAMQQQSIDALVIDVTGNGGGSSWVEAAARVFSAPGLRSPRIGFVKHPHWVKHFQDRLNDVETDLKRSELSDVVRESLRAAQAQVKAALAAAASACDRSAVWTGGTACSSVVISDLATTGAFAARPPFALRGLDADWVLFNAHAYPNLDGAYRGALAILVDEKTASAAEQFTAMLKDDGGATVIGRKTLGAGCGYTNGGIAITLKHSGMRLRAPDCLRARKDGSNEVLGIVPDAVLRNTSRASYVAAVSAWISALHPKTSKPAHPN